MVRQAALLLRLDSSNEKLIAISLRHPPSEVVREALRLLEQEDELRALKMQRLRRDILEGLESGPSARFDPEEIKRTAREKKADKSPK
jgi:antitoxin ParD1/3/4